MGPPSAPRVLRTDDLSGEINEWGWIDASPSLAPNKVCSPSPPPVDEGSGADACEDVELHKCNEKFAFFGGVRIQKERNKGKQAHPVLPFRAF